MINNSQIPLNAWYPAAWSHEIGHALVARKICGHAIVLYRRRDNRLAALRDACWHRLLPLSMGRLDGDDVVCGYHGLAFDSSGHCTYMPAQKAIIPGACVPAYPVAEKHRLVWIWPGDPARADLAAIPDFHWNDNEEWVGEGGTFYSLKCEYRLVVDNLMDLTHETYVHAGSIGHDAIVDTPFEASHTDDSATVKRWMENIEPPPFWAQQLGKPGNVDRWQIIHFHSPSIVIGEVGVAPTGTGAPQGDRSQGVSGAFLAAIAPETSTSCHYFWNFVRTFRRDDAGLTRDLQLAHVNDGQGVYDQDREVLEAQQRAIEDNPDMHLRNLNIDLGGRFARRIIAHMAEGELAGSQQAAQSTTPALGALRSAGL